MAKSRPPGSREQKQLVFGPRGSLNLESIKLNLHFLAAIVTSGGRCTTTTILAACVSNLPDVSATARPTVFLSIIIRFYSVKIADCTGKLSSHITGQGWGT